MDKSPRLLSSDTTGFHAVRSELDGEFTPMTELCTLGGTNSKATAINDDAGQMVSSGIYMYRIEAQSSNGDKYMKTRKMVVLR